MLKTVENEEELIKIKIKTITGTYDIAISEYKVNV